MTRLEILELRSDKLYDQKAGIDNRVSALSKRLKQQKKLVLQKYFTNDFPEYYSTVVTSDECVQLRVEGNRYAIGDIYFYDRFSEGKMLVENAEISLSSFRTEIDKGEEAGWISKRFEAISKFVMIVEDFGDDMIAELNMIEAKYRNLIESFYPSRKELTTSIDSLSKDMDKLKKEELMNKLFDADGISLTPEEKDSYLPRFDLKWDWEISSVAGLRAIRKSASGKSVDLEVKRRIRDYNSNEWKIDVVKAERVRFDKVESFLRRNKKYIVS